MTDSDLHKAFDGFRYLLLVEESYREKEPDREVLDKIGRYLDVFQQAVAKAKLSLNYFTYYTESNEFRREFYIENPRDKHAVYGLDIRVLNREEKKMFAENMRERYPGEFKVREIYQALGFDITEKGSKITLKKLK